MENLPNSMLFTVNRPLISKYNAKFCHLLPKESPPIPTLIPQNPSVVPPSHVPTEHRTRMTLTSAHRPRFRPRVRRRRIRPRPPEGEEIPESPAEPTTLPPSTPS
ncbi:hypothetical protein F2P56_011030 [Juglans regia]|uniref:Uncharacterized protein n=1 Tax=Juglans regia TaxID=51240 RepID=A0A833XSR2_JUGRE|nr:hypothetical protein F2P56_011030 [Juglans regia]